MQDDASDFERPQKLSWKQTKNNYSGYELEKIGHQYG